MAAVATMKPGGQHAALQTFPYVFQQDFNAGTAYFPSQTGPAIALMTGETFQGEYHRQKQADAVQSVYNGLANNRAKEQKLLTGTANYHLPRPVLGQRIFANPSLGAGETSSARLDTGRGPWHLMETSLMPATMNAHQMQGSGMYIGGVMKTREGFDYYTANLQARIQQLNAMNSLASGVPVARGPLTQPTSDSRTTGSIDKVEFFLLLQTLQDSITSGDLTRFTFDNLKKLMSAMFRFGPTADKEDFDDMISSISSIRLDLEQGIEEVAGQENQFVDSAYAETLILYMEGLNGYVAEMFKNMNLSEKDRITLSKSLIKTLGFTKLQTKRTPAEVVQAVRPGNERVNQAAEDFDDQFGGDGPPDDGGGDGHFNHPAEAREDEDQDNRPRAPFAAEGNGGDPNRDAWGAERAPGAREQNFAYFGAEQQDQPEVVQPLNPVGLALPPGMDLGQAGDQVNAAVNDLLGTGGGGGGGQGRYDIMIRGMEPYIFVQTLVETLERDGMAPPDIATGMMPINQEFRGAFTEYITQHAPNQVREPDLGLPQPPMAPPPRQAPAQHPFAQAMRAGLPMGINTRGKLRLLSEAQLRKFGSELPGLFGGPYQARSGTSLKQQRIALIRRIRASEAGHRLDF